jgi:hypothetical protein
VKDVVLDILRVLRLIGIVLGIAALLLIVLPVACIHIYINWHAESAQTRRAIAAEARVAMRYAPAPARDTMPETLDLAQLTHDVARDEAPRTLTALAPDRVYVGPDGVFIVMRNFVTAESGYFVPRAGMTPTDHGDFRFTPLGDGVWWYVDED